VVEPVRCALYGIAIATKAPRVSPNAGSETMFPTRSKRPLSKWCQA